MTKYFLLTLLFITNDLFGKDEVVSIFELLEKEKYSDQFLVTTGFLAQDIGSSHYLLFPYKEDSDVDNLFRAIWLMVEDNSLLAKFEKCAGQYVVIKGVFFSESSTSRRQFSQVSSITPFRKDFSKPVGESCW